MARRWVVFHACVLNGSLLLSPSVASAQQPLSAATPATFDEASLQTWSKRIVEQINEAWSESNNVQRQRKLQALIGTTPAETSFISRTLKRPELALRAGAVSALRDVTATMRRSTWRTEDAASVQYLTAGWTALVPDLVDTLSDKEANADFRRQIGKALIDLATMTRDPATTSEKARKMWQGQLTTLSDLSHHPKTTIRLVALNVLEALGQEAAQAKPAIVQALGDPDRFVRWSAVRALEAIGLDQSSMQSLATLQHDPDVDVQKAAVSVLQAVPGGAEALALQQKAPPLKTAVLAEVSPKSPVATLKTPAMAKTNAPANDADASSKKIFNKWVKATPKPADANQSTFAPTTEASAPTVDSLAKAKYASGLTLPPAYPAASPEGEALALRSAPIIVPKTLPSTGIRRAPEAFSAEIAEVSPPSNPISKTTEPEPIAPKPEAVPLISSTTPLDVQPARAVPPSTVPQLTAPISGLQRAPESLQLSGSEALPMWTPPAPVLKGNEIKAAAPVAPPAPVKQPAIQPIAAQITITEPILKKAPNLKGPEFNQQLMTDIVKLNSARVADQLEGIRSLGKLGPNAADAVPPLAEKLVKGETLVRREVPLALMQIGAPAKLAQTVLERALDDQDTDVRVNAARALLELSDK